MEDIKLVPISAKDIKALDETEYKNLSEEKRKQLVSYSEKGEHGGEFFRFYLVKIKTETVGVINVCGHGSKVISVAPEIIERYRNKGYAAKSLALAYSLAKEQGFEEATAKIREENFASRRLHEKAGFEFKEKVSGKNGNVFMIYTRKL